MVLRDSLHTLCNAKVQFGQKKKKKAEFQWLVMTFFFLFAFQVELARKRGWKGYWVCLKGTTLLFYPCDSREGRSVEATPKHLIIVDGAIMQAIPEHPKRDYIFCLSTAFGDAYLFQVSYRTSALRQAKQPSLIGS